MLGTLYLLTLAASNSRSVVKVRFSSLKRDTDSERLSNLVKDICDWHQDMVVPGLFRFPHFMEFLLEIDSYQVGSSSFVSLWFDGCLAPPRPVPHALKSD